MAEVSVAGKNRFLKQMRRLTPVAREALTDQLDQNADFLMSKISPLIPVDEGELKNSLRKHETTGSEGLAIQVIEGGAEAPHAFLVEHGTDDTDAQPHFFSTYRRWRANMRGKISTRLRKLFKQGANP